MVAKVAQAMKLDLVEKNKKSISDHLNKNMLKKIKDEGDNETKKLWGKMEMVEKVEGFPAFEEKLFELLAAGGDIFVMFSGSKTAAGESWCPDCVAAKPVVTKSLANAVTRIRFLYVVVGDRATWKDSQCNFR